MSKEKLLASAQKNLEKGQLAKAIKDYQAVVDIDPRDIRNRQKLAELYSRARQNEQALEQYAAVAKYYSENGFYLKAIAVYKQMQRLDPARPELYLRLAELNQKQGLAGNAAAEYRNLLSFYESRKMFPEAVGVLEKLKELEPENLNLRINIVETFLRGGVQERAKKEFEEVLALLRQKGEAVRALRLFELFLPLYPNDTELKTGYGETLVRHGDVKKGVQVLTQLAAREPENLRILQALAEGYRRQRDFGNERTILQKGLALGADNLELREALIRALLSAGEYQGALAELERCQESFLQARRLEAVREFADRLLAALPNEPRVRRLQRGSGEPEGESDIDFPAEGAFEMAPSVEPVPLHPPQKAPNVAAADTLAEVVPLRDPILSDAAEAEELSLADLSSLSDLFLLEKPSELPQPSPSAPTGDPAVSAPAPEREGEELELELEMEFDLELAPAGLYEGELEELAEELTEELPSEHPAVLTAEPETAAGEEEEAAVLDLTEEDAEELELLELELAQDIPPTILSGVDAHETIGGSAPPSQSVAEFVDLRAVLLEAEEADDVEAEAVLFPAAKKGIRTEGVQLEDAESHFQLGIAYKEMGLLEDAVKEFEQAMKDPARGVACLILKGICLAERGENDQAANAFKAGLSHPRLEENEKLSLHFELGTLHEVQGQFLDALDSFQYVADHDLFFREVGQRIVSLRRRLGLDPGIEGGEKPVTKGNRQRVSYV